MTPRPSLRVAAFLVFVFIPAGVATAFLPLWLTQRGLSAAEIGTVLGVASLLRLTVVPGWGWLGDRIGRRRTLGLAAAAGSVACAGYFAPGGFWPMLVAGVAAAATASPLMPIADALSLSLARDGKLDYGRVRASGSAAYMLATGVAGWLVGLFGAVVVPTAMVVFYAGAALLSLPLPEAHARPASRAHAAGGFRLLRHKPFRLAVATAALTQGSHAAAIALATLHWRSQGLSDSVIGLLWTEAVLAEVALFYWGRRVGDRLGPGGLVAVCAVACALRWTAIGLTSNLAVLAVVQALHGATYGMQHLAAMLTLSRTVPPERAASAQTAYATLGAAVPVGVLMFLSGRLYDGGGTVFLLMAAIGGAAVLLAAPLQRAVASAEWRA